MCIPLIALTLLSLQMVSSSPGVYVDKLNPYTPGKLKTATLVLGKDDDSPMHTTVIFPSEPGQYAVVYFVPGAPAGVIPAEWYTDLLTKVSSRGFIVLAIDAFWPAASTSFTDMIFNGLYDRHIEHINWLRKNLDQKLTSGVKSSWENLGLACHSAGCDVTLGILQNEDSIAKSTVFLEPASWYIKKKPGIKVPAYMSGTEFSEQPGPFICSIPGRDYNTFYETWGCPKWLTEVANYGHCDVLDSFAWHACHYGHFCKTVGDWSRVYPVYHEYASGAMAAFFIGTLQDFASSLKYIQDRTLSPLKLLKSNYTLTC